MWWALADVRCALMYAHPDIHRVGSMKRIKTVPGKKSNSGKGRSIFKMYNGTANTKVVRTVMKYRTGTLRNICRAILSSNIAASRRSLAKCACKKGRKVATTAKVAIPIRPVRIAAPSTARADVTMMVTGTISQIMLPRNPLNPNQNK